MGLFAGVPKGLSPNGLEPLGDGIGDSEPTAYGLPPYGLPPYGLPPCDGAGARGGAAAEYRSIGFTVGGAFPKGLPRCVDDDGADTALEDPKKSN